MLHDSLSYDLMQGHGQGDTGVKCAKMADFKGGLFCLYACSQKTNGEC